VISSVTQAFCGDCNRARLSTEGKLYLCLFAVARARPARAAARRRRDAELASAIGHIWGQRDDRYSELRGSLAAGPTRPRVEMSYIGYAAWGHPVVVDRIGGHAGPLAGVHAALSQIQTDWLLCVPCDAPWFPEDLAVCLSDAVARGGCLAAVACSPAVGGGAVVLQPTFCLLHRTLRTSVESFLHSGEHKAALWLDSVAAARVVFSPGDHGDMFANLNTQVELDRAREA
jgi:molybdopterin-guanine dinucleotide biosynthesis protein A